MNAMETTGEDFVLDLFLQPLDWHVCSVCAKYRERYGKPPHALLVAMEVAIQLQPGRACVPVIPFVVTHDAFFRTMPDKSLVVAVDDSWKFYDAL